MSSNFGLANLVLTQEAEVARLEERYNALQVELSVRDATIASLKAELAAERDQRASSAMDDVKQRVELASSLAQANERIAALAAENAALRERQSIVVPAQTTASSQSALASGYTLKITNRDVNNNIRELYISPRSGED